MIYVKYLKTAKTIMERISHITFLIFFFYDKMTNLVPYMQKLSISTDHEAWKTNYC